MSLINDALKKAENQLGQKNKNPAIPPSREPNPEGAPKKSASSKFPLYATLAVLVGISAIIAGMTLYKPKKLPIPQKTAYTPSTPIDKIENMPMGTVSFESDKESLAMAHEKPFDLPTEPEEPIQPAIADLESQLQEPEEKPMMTSVNQQVFESLIGMASKMMGGNNDQATPSTPKTSNTSMSSEPKTYHLTKRASPTTNKTEAQTAASVEEDPIELFLKKLNITGIMFAGKDSKVLMNNQVYSIDAIVDTTLKLKLVEIQPHTLIFTDVTGKQYSKEL